MKVLGKYIRIRYFDPQGKLNQEARKPGGGSYSGC